ncbi:MAG: ABC transporter ATP-binding protein [Pseudomonadota bacterium]
MITNGNSKAKGEVLLEMRGLRIEGQSDEQWHEIVHGVDVTLNRGEVLGLIGESGAGKSTIGIAAMGYARPGCRISGGTIKFDGMELTTLGEDAKRKLRGSRIAYVAQSAAASFNPAHRLIDQYSETPIQHGIMSKSQAESEAKELFGRLKLPDPDNIGYRYPHQVSGGQLQRAMTAMAMSCKPDLIVFDEPTTALDVTTQIEVLAAMKKIVHDFNTAAIYITHDLAVVAQMSDRIMVLRYGDLVEEGQVRQMIAEPKQDYTRDLLEVRSYRKAEAADTSGERPLLEVSDVTAGYGNKVMILKDVGVTIHRQRTVSVVGESGSGKSTLARVITGLLPPVKGSVVYDGEEWPRSFKERSRDQLRRLQMIYQMPDVAVNPKQKIRDIIGRPLSFYLGITGSAREQRIKELLEMIELPHSFADRLPGELSGGQKQRICIARALAAEPELIICDEVTSALDQLVAEEILKLLQRLQDTLHVSYLFITHDLATVRAISDEVVVMLQGRVVEQGRTREIFKPPHHEYTDLLLSSVPEMDPDWLDNLLAERQARVARGEKLAQTADN